MKERLLRFLACAALAAAQAAWALTPAEVFEKVSPSVWAVRGYDAAERGLAYGTAVVIGPGRLVTNCHVLAKASNVMVGRDNVRYGAKLEHADVQRDLCTLSVANFSAPATSVADPGRAKVGSRVYAIGNPRGFALTLSEGIVSGFRDELLQTTAPISPGSSGGGLFDDEGKLIGITTFTVTGADRLAQNLNFAVPAKWIADVPERSKAALAKREARSSGTKAGTAAPPAAGSRWIYAWRNDTLEGRFTVRLHAVDGTNLTEAFGDAADAPSYRASGGDAGFQVRLVDNHRLYELAPYLLSYNPNPEPSLLHPEPYPAAEPSDNWTVRVASVDQERISVPAGSFTAVRVTVIGENALADSPRRRGAHRGDRLLRFEFRAWYAPQTGRYVRSHYQVFSRAGPVLDERVELVQFELPSPQRAAAAPERP